MNFLTALALALLTSSAHAAFDRAKGVSFYRTRFSAFPSGQASLSTLEKTAREEKFEMRYLVQSGFKTFWVSGRDIARDQHFNLKGNELGACLNLLKTHLRDRPDWRSEVVSDYPAMSAFAVEKIEGTWARVRALSGPSYVGYIDLNIVLMKADFASFALTKKKGWVPVKYRMGSDLITTQEERLPLSEVTSLFTRPELAISVTTSDNPSLALRQHLTIQKTEAETWVSSHVPQHGIVYWKKNDSEQIQNLQIQGLSSEEILKRPIFSVAFHPKNPKIGLVAAQGVYFTVDGISWQQIPQFKNENHPVAISAKGEWYIGAQRSVDKGKSFSTYFKIEQLAQLVEQKQKSPPKSMKISNLEFVSNEILKVMIETELSKISIATKTTYLADRNLQPKWEIY